MSDDIPNLERLIKLMQMTKSDRDGEALAAIRMANKMIDKWNADWEKILSGRVTVIGDPFAGVSAPTPRRNAPPPPKRPAPAPRPASQPGASWRTASTGPAQPQPRRASPRFDPSAPQPAQPSPQMPRMSFTQVSGQWRVRSNRPLVVGDHYEIPTRNSGLRRVKITQADGTNVYGDYLYMSVNAPLNVGDFL